MDTYQFKSLEKAQYAIDQGNNLNLLKDISVPYAVNIGKGEISIKELMNLSHNTVIPLNHLVGEPFTLYVGNGEKKAFAVGELVEDGEGLSFKVKKIL